MPQKFNINSRTVAAPLAAFCMATILFVYSRTSIRAAKRNAQKHRESDGGQISWQNESLRRHGMLEPPEAQGAVKQLFLGGRDTGAAKDGGREGAGAGSASSGRTEAEVRILAVRAGKGSGRDGS